MTTDEELQSMKVDKKYIRETVEEYHMTLLNLNKSTNQYPTKEINGGRYYIVEMSLEDFIKSKNAKKMDDIQWTM